MKVSIIIPVFNTVTYLEACLASVLTQSHFDIEVLCIDDGSTDASLNLLKTIQDSDSRIKTISTQHFGVSHARNIGLNLATGDAVMFVDSDDELLPDAVEILVSCLTDDVESVISSTEYVLSNFCGVRQYLTGNSRLQLRLSGVKSLMAKDLFELSCTPFAKLFRRRAIDKINLRFPEGLYFEDVYWHWIFYTAFPRTYLTTLQTYTYFKRNNSITDRLWHKEPGLGIQYLEIVDLLFSQMTCALTLQTKNLILQQALTTSLSFSLDNEKQMCHHKAKSIKYKYQLNVHS